MSVGATPPPILQFFDNAGNPNAGGSVLTQVGGVNYPTYEDSGGTTPLPNPIPLNSRGEISNASGVSSQLFLVSGVTYTFTVYDVNGNVIDTASSVTAPLTAVPASSLSEWVVQSAPTYASATSFTVANNQTGTFTVNRRVQAVITSGTITGSITASSYSSTTNATTVTVVWDSGALDSSVSQVATALLSSVNPSVPAEYARQDKPNTFTALNTFDSLTATLSGAGSVAGCFDHFQILTGSGNFNPPSTGNYFVLLIGAGGGGGTGATPTGTIQSGTNGWAGGFGQWVFDSMALTAGTPVAYSVGAGGTGGVANASGSQAQGVAGNGGANTTFGSITAIGGAGGAGGSYQNSSYNAISPVDSLMPGSSMPGGPGAGQLVNSGVNGGNGQNGLIVVMW